jgi:outer membrane protein
MKKAFVILFFFAGFYSSLFSQSKTLRECIDIAWERNINIKQVELSEWSSDIDIAQAKAARYPSLNAGTSLNLSGRSVDPTNNQFAASSFYTNNYNLSSNMLLYRGGQVANSIKRANQSRTAVTYQIDNIKQDIALQVANAYINVVLSQENLGITEKRRDATREQIKQLELFIENGLRPKNAIYDLRASIATDEQNVVAAQGNLDIAYLNLLQLMNVSPSEKFDLVIPTLSMESLTDPFVIDANDMFNKSWKNQPAYKNANMQIEIAETDRKIAAAGLRPTVGIGGSVGTNYSSLGREVESINEEVFNQTILINGTEQTVGFVQQVPNLIDQPYFDQINENVTYGYGLSVQVPIYNNMNTKASIQKAELNRKSTNYGMELEELQFRNEVEQVLLQAKNAKKQYEASLISVEAGKQALDNITNSFEAGAANIYDLTFAQNTYDTALIQSAIAKYDYIFKSMIIDFYLGRSINF